MPPNPTPPFIRHLTPQVSTISLPFDRFNRLALGLRTTIIRLPSGSLVVFSPSPLTPQVTTHLNSLGNNVTYLIAPDIEHHIHLSAWKKAYPSAHILAPHGLYEKRQKQGRDDTGPFTHIYQPQDFAIGKERTPEAKWGRNLPEENVRELEEVFDVEYIPAHANREIVLLHKPDGGTLIEADMLFNLPAHEQYSLTDPKRDPAVGWTMKLITSFLGLGKEGREAKGQRRFAWWLTGRKDRRGFAYGVGRVAGWQFERIVPCHGDVVERDAKGKWEDVFRWYLDMKME